MTGEGADGTGPVEAAFAALVSALNGGDAAGFAALLHAETTVIDEDTPFVLDRAGFLEHLGFHATVWERFHWLVREVRFARIGDTGLVAGGATFRGKPLDAGYRLRHLLFTQAWVAEAGTWRLVQWHLSPVAGFVTGASPA